MSPPPRPGRLLLGIALAALAAKTLVLDLALVEGASMEPCLKPGHAVLLLRASYGLRLPFTLAPGRGYALSWASPRRGQVVAARNPRDGGAVVKRVVAVGPLRLRVISGRLVGEGTSIELGGRDWAEGREVELRQGEYFLVGDNSPESIDSRDYGPLSLGFIEGRILGLGKACGGGEEAGEKAAPERVAELAPFREAGS
jgi:signal peptidase I